MVKCIKGRNKQTEKAHTKCLFPEWNNLKQKKLSIQRFGTVTYRPIMLSRSPSKKQLTEITLFNCASTLTGDYLFSALYGRRSHEPHQSCPKAARPIPIRPNSEQVDRVPNGNKAAAVAISIKRG